jgi:hypothetical protein
VSPVIETPGWWTDVFWQILLRGLQGVVRKSRGFHLFSSFIAFSWPSFLKSYLFSPLYKYSGSCIMGSL